MAVHLDDIINNACAYFKTKDFKISLWRNEIRCNTRFFLKDIDYGNEIAIMCAMNIVTTNVGIYVFPATLWEHIKDAILPKLERVLWKKLFAWNIMLEKHFPIIPKLTTWFPIRYRYFDVKLIYPSIPTELGQEKLVIKIMEKSEWQGYKGTT